jgi:hypothetical protein
MWVKESIMILAHKVLALAALAGLATAVHADIVTYTGNTSGGATYNRLVEDLSMLSAIGTAVRYQTFTFQVSAAGTYAVTSTAKFDNFTFLYAPTLNPATPLVNVQAGSDDLLTGFTTSGFSADLIPGVDYVAVTTGFADNDFGAFSNTIVGAGTIIPSAPLPPPAPVAGLVTITGDTSGGPGFNRPVEDLSALSAIGTDVAYRSYGFTVDASGSYTFLISALFDSFGFLYSPALNTAVPLDNALVANDDLLIGFSTSGFAFDLVSGTPYYLVTTGFANTDFGSFSATIGGPGNILPIDDPVVPGVPEPAGVALVLLGLGTMALAGRRSAARRAQLLRVAARDRAPMPTGA